MGVVASATLVRSQVVVRDDVPLARVAEYVEAHPDAVAYHQPAWMNVIHAAFGQTTKYLVAEADARVVGVLPLVFFRSALFGRFAVSMPFVNYGGVLADSSEAEVRLLESAIRETRGHG